MPTGIRQLLDTIALPAFVEGRYFDVLAANHLAYALSPNLVIGQNRLRAVFLDPAEQALYPDWDRATTRLVAGFRSSVGNDTDDPRFVQLVGELSLTSERFRLLWARHDVRIGDGTPERIHHPQVGELTLSREKLAIKGAEGQVLVLYHAQPGTASGEKLALLASLASPPAEAAHDQHRQHPTPQPHPCDAAAPDRVPTHELMRGAKRKRQDNEKRQSWHKFFVALQHERSRDPVAHCRAEEDRGQVGRVIGHCPAGRHLRRTQPSRARPGYHSSPGVMTAASTP